MSRIGDTPWICPSCGNHLGGYKGSSKGSEVVAHGVLQLEDGTGKVHEVDVVKCGDCGVVFAVAESTVPTDG